MRVSAIGSSGSAWDTLEIDEGSKICNFQNSLQVPELRASPKAFQNFTL